MFSLTFSISYIIGLVIGSGIRAWYGARYKQNRAAIFREEGFLVGLLASLWGIAILLPLVYMFTSWLDFADYRLPIWAGFTGIIIFAAALWLLWRSHADLGRNWSVTTEIKEAHRLVTSGVFHRIRHPMYAAHWLWGIAQALLIPNWIAGLSSLIVFIPLYLLRVPREERVMMEHFGDEYRDYVRQTGRVLPRLW